MTNLVSDSGSYRKFCSQNPDIPIYHQPWWLDATAGEGNWSAVMVYNSSDVRATLPYILRNRAGSMSVTQPKFTQYLGPYLVDDGVERKYQKRLENEKKYHSELIKRLPKFHYFSQNFSPDIGNWLPWYWNGFKQTTFYTYRLENTTNIEDVWLGLSENVRRNIRKGEKNELRIDRHTPLDEFQFLLKRTVAKKRIRIANYDGVVERIDRACKEKDTGCMLTVRDKEDRLLSGVYLVWDKRYVYYIIGASDPELKTNSAKSMLIWEAIKVASKQNKGLDLEGSMIEPIERFFRSFGAIQTPYFNITKSNSKLLDFYRILSS